MLVGVISDTHGFFDPRVPPLLRGVDHIMHAGDIGGGEIIEQLREIAPVTAVRGNNDREGPESRYPEEAALELGGCRIYLTHIVKPPREDDASALAVFREKPADLVVFGHSHIAFNDRRGGLLFFNPGAAGKRRFKAVPSVGLLELNGGTAEGRVIAL